MGNGSYIDLHVHSNCSDGKKSIEEIIGMCVKNNVGIISFAEHYNMGSYKKARYLAEPYGIEVIPSIEIGASMECFGLSNNHICHIVAYYPSYKICTILDQYELSREKCVRHTLEKLNKYVPIKYSQVKMYARDKNSIGRYDIAIALAKLGYCSDPVRAYGDYLDYGKTAYVTREKEQAPNLIRKIVSLGGLPVIVHPKSMKLGYQAQLDIFRSFKFAGLCGIEVYNPHNTPEQVCEFMELANLYGLIPTVGSDYHGRQDSNIEIGLGIDGNLGITDLSIISSLKKRKTSMYTKKLG